MSPTDNEWYETRLKDLMYLLLEESGASDEYAKGVLVGAVAALNAVNRNNNITTIKPFLPEGFRVEVVPETWKEFLL